MLKPIYFVPLVGLLCLIQNLSGQGDILLEKNRRIEEIRSELNIPLTSSKRVLKSSINDVVCSYVVDNDSPIGGPLESRIFYTNHYDDNDLLSRVVIETDRGVDGIINSRYIRNITRDGAGRIISSQTDRDSDLDGMYDGLETRQYTYNSNGLLEKFTWVYDFVLADPEIKSFNFYYFYSPSGQLIREDYDWDVIGNDGIPDYFSRTDYSYNAKGLLIRGDGQDYFTSNPMDISLNTRVYEYDSNNYLVKSTWEFDEDADMMADSRQIFTYVNNSFGKLLSSLREFDDNLDGTTDRSIMGTNTYCSLSVPSLSDWGIVILTLSMLILGVSAVDERPIRPKLN